MQNRRETFSRQKIKHRNQPTPPIITSGAADAAAVNLTSNPGVVLAGQVPCFVRGVAADRQEIASTLKPRVGRCWDVTASQDYTSTGKTCDYNGMNIGCTVSVIIKDCSHCLHCRIRQQIAF